MMQSGKKYVKPIFKMIRRPFKRLKVYVKQQAGWLGVPKILPYRSFGNHHEVFIHGMVIEDKGLSKPLKNQSALKNVLATMKRFSSDEINGAKVRAEFLGKTQIVETDQLGFYCFQFDVSDTQSQIQTKEWHTVHLELLDQVVENQPPVRATGEVRIINPQDSRIIVSDIDDTVLVSHSTQTLKKLRLMLFKNAMSRLPFPGVTAFYRGLSRGKENRQDYPFFFVSSSEWNLYDLLDDFFHYNHIPKGVFMLRRLEYSIYKFWKSGGGDHEHKYKKIRFLLHFYPDHQFILIGDSGQKDPDIYRRLYLEFPGRIEMIYIRKIGIRNLINKHDKLLSQLTRDHTYLEVKDTIEAARDALEKGYIESSVLDEVISVSKKNK